MIQSEKKELFKELADQYIKWVTLENLYYQCTHLANYSYVNHALLDLTHFYFASAPFGGPMAFLMNNRIIQSGNQDYKNKILVHSSYGEKISELSLENYIQDYNPKIPWVLFEFTKEEDILLLNQEGFLIVIDPMTSLVKFK